MKAHQAIYQNGHIDFLFTLPESHGPTNVLIIFPESEPIEQDQEPFFWDEWEKNKSNGDPSDD